MSERQLQFRVGMVVIISGVCAAVMILQFGEFAAFWRTPLTAIFASSWASATGSPTVRTLLGDLARFAAATRMGSWVMWIVSWRGQPDHQATFRHHSPTPSPPIRRTSFQSLKPFGGYSTSMVRPGMP